MQTITFGKAISIPVNKIDAVQLRLDIKTIIVYTGFMNFNSDFATEEEANEVYNLIVSTINAA